jgi:hypothetical protein
MVYEVLQVHRKELAAVDVECDVIIDFTSSVYGLNANPVILNL